MTGVERRQVFDLPDVTIKVVEHQLIERECGCGHRTKGMAPQGAEAPAQYGPRIAAIIVYLYLGQFLSKQRTAQALAELFGIPLSSGTVAGITARAAGRLSGFLEHTRDQIAASDVAGFDETGFRVDGKLHWVHCARTGKYTLLMVHPRRGTEATEAMGVLPLFNGVAVHDAWAPYDTYTAPDHQLCCAHALRELQAVTDAAAGAGGAGLPRPPRRSPRCRHWSPRRSARAATPWTRPRWPPRSTSTAPPPWPGPARPPPAPGR